ncbi:hypothetical protein [Paraburkholderia xenovorans]|uniref:hypothetical protein n=1 Tax=Paraburkholderia xenovorans TaxID=36873 RepID=UPI00130D6AF8|nr:hypothetical protein [Paraburkholderia xenovorans]
MTRATNDARRRMTREALNASDQGKRASCIKQAALADGAAPLQSGSCRAGG